MMVLVVGQRGDGPLLRRVVTMREFRQAWGRWAGLLLSMGEAGVELEGCHVWAIPAGRR